MFAGTQPPMLSSIKSFLAFSKIEITAKTFSNSFLSLSRII